MTTSNDRVAAELAIRDVVARYSDAINRRDTEAWSETWARSSEWNLLGVTASGREAIVAKWLEFMAQIPFVLQFPTFGVVEISGSDPDASVTHATGRWYINEISKRPTRSSTTLGVYHDHYVIEDGSWRFSKRRFDVLYRSSDELTGTPQPLPSDIQGQDPARQA